MPLVTMALHVAANDCAVENVESSQQRRGAVPFVIVFTCMRQSAVKSRQKTSFFKCATDSMVRDCWCGRAPNLRP
jgi:hypothetical protein